MNNYLLWIKKWFCERSILGEEFISFVEIAIALEYYINILDIATS